MGKKGKKKRRSTRKTYPSAAFQWATVQAPGIPPPPPPVPPLRPSPAFPRTSLGLSSPIPRRSRSRHPLLARRAAPQPPFEPKPQGGPIQSVRMAFYSSLLPAPVSRVRAITAPELAASPPAWKGVSFAAARRRGSRHGGNPCPLNLVS